ncbi:hypothetical protein [Microseira wollei]|uniref:hypothetical protein n=1 Tax=Microseira wollei TaxID=467598 RepID=UPI001CFD72A2|nr:hypothetical protein [Microseira wollei]
MRYTKCESGSKNGSRFRIPAPKGCTNTSLQSAVQRMDITDVIRFSEQKQMCQKFLSIKERSLALLCDMPPARWRDRTIHPSK